MGGVVGVVVCWGSVSAAQGCCDVDRLLGGMAVVVCPGPGPEEERTVGAAVEVREGWRWCDGEFRPPDPSMRGAVAARLAGAERWPGGALTLGDRPSGSGGEGEVVGGGEDDHEVEEGVADDGGSEAVGAFAQESEQE